MGYLDRAGELFSRHGAKLYLDQVLAKKQQLVSHSPLPALGEIPGVGIRSWRSRRCARPPASALARSRHQ